jgi:hypothetical protein
MSQVVCCKENNTMGAICNLHLASSYFAVNKTAEEVYVK